MKRYLAIIGTLLIATILISGHVVAQTWTVAVRYGGYTFDCTDETEAIDARDGDHATVGVNYPSETLGQLTLDFGAGNGIPNDYEFRVCAVSYYNETYVVNVLNYDDTINTTAGNGWDTEDCYFTTPSSGGPWRYVMIIGTSGASVIGDLNYGPEIDAVGYY